MGERKIGHFRSRHGDDWRAASSYRTCQFGLKVKTHMKDAMDTVSLDAKFAQLTDGTSYPDAITLDVASQKVTIAVDNSGYRKMGQ